MKIGIKTYIGHRVIHICSCGQRILNTRYHVTRCDKCGNNEFLDLTEYKSRTKPKFEVVEKNEISFKLKRTNVSYSYDEDYNITTKDNMVQVFSYNMVTGVAELTKTRRNGVVEILDWTEDFGKHTNAFFRGVDEAEFKDLVSTIKNKDLYNGALSHWNRRGYYSSSPRGSYFNVLLGIKNNLYAQTLYNCGMTNYYGLLNNLRNTIDREKTKPHEILKVPKFAVKYVVEAKIDSGYTLSKLQKVCQEVDGNTLKELFDIAKDESSISSFLSYFDDFMKLTKNHYNNQKKLLLYLTREIKLHQGIERYDNGLTTLRDYINMMVAMNLSFEKYPKSLKKSHDIAMLNYRVMTNEREKVQFANHVEQDEYKKLEFKSGIYRIISPKEPKDLIEEGNNLSHCIASYVKEVINGRCKIYFLRTKDELDKSLVSIEVRNDNIRQVKGFANRQPSKMEKDIVDKWALKNNLVVNCY